VLRLFVLIVAFAMVVPMSAEAGRRADQKLAHQARKHKKAGLKHLKKGKLDSAIDELQIAYGLAPEPILLYSLGEAYNRKKEYPQALYYYRQYRNRDPKGAKKRGVGEIIAALEGLTAPTEATAAAEPKPPEPDSSTEPAPQPSPEPSRRPPPKTEPEPRAPTAPAEEAPPEPEPEPAPMVATTVSRRGGGGGGKRIAGLVLGGLGVAAAGAGGYFAYVAHQRESDISELFADGGTWSDEYDRLYGEGREARTRSMVLLGAGGAAVVVGGVLYYLGVRDGAARTVEVAPVAGGGATVGVTCGF